MDDRSVARPAALCASSAIAVNIEELVAACPREEQAELLVRLVAADIRVRRDKGEAVGVSSYLDRFPEHRELLSSLNSDIESACKSLVSTISREDQNAPRVPAAVPRVVFPAGEAKLLGRYQLQKQIGRGGFGEVWQAFDPELHRPVAIKIFRRDKEFSETAMASLVDEGRKLAQLRHGGIIQVFDVGRIDNLVYLVSEFVPGGTLLDCHRAARLSFDRIAGLVADLADALHAAHRQGIVHRDIKPTNVLMDEAGRPRLADFGLAATEQDLLYEGRATIGTISYMSPEQHRGDSHLVDSRSDIYSLGVVLYELLTDRLPFLGNSASQWKEQVLTREPRPPRTIDDRIPAWLEAVCLKCLAKEVSARYTTAQELAEALRRTGAARTRKSPPWLFLSLTAALLLLAAGVYPLWQRFFGPAEKEPSSNPPAVVAVEAKPPLEQPPAQRELPDVSQMTGPDWQPLLAVQPRLALWPEKTRNSKLDFLADKRELEAMCAGAGMLTLGSAKGDLDLQLAFSQPGGDGGFGIYWGLQPDPDRGPLARQFHTIKLQKVLDKGKRQLKLVEEFTVISHRGEVLHSERLTLEHPAIAGREAEVSLRIRGGTLESLTWNHQQVAVPTSEAIAKYLPSVKADQKEGEFGVSLSYTAAVIHSAYARQPQ
jgi:hypothetical protein